MVLGDLKRDSLESLKREIASVYPHTKTWVRVLDVTDASSCRSIAELCETQFNRIDAVIHSAAIDPKFEQGSDPPRFSKFTEFPEELWQSSLDVNLTGAFLLAQATCKVMEKSGKGSIIFLGSNYGLVGPDQRIYRKSWPRASNLQTRHLFRVQSGPVGIDEIFSRLLYEHGHSDKPAHAQWSLKST